MATPKCFGSKSILVSGIQTVMRHLVNRFREIKVDRSRQDERDDIAGFEEFPSTHRKQHRIFRPPK
jgi:hypothetical protein